jgi:hypothetical protein
MGIQNTGGGWYRLTMTATLTSSATGNVIIALNNSDVTSLQSYTGTATGSYIRGAQVEQSSTVGEYIPTTSTINSAPRFDHNPTTGESLGLLVEEQRTNSIRNNTMVGAVAGTPGTVPTNWVAGSANVGISREIIGTGTENGITYIDLKYSGTTTGSGLFNIIPDDGVTASSGQAWTSSAYVKVIGGSTANLTLIHRIRQAVSGGGFLAATDQTLSPVSGDLIKNRYTLTLSSAPATIASLGQYFIVSFAASGLAIDVTLRIGLPQLEQGAFATSVIPTTTAAVTRSADVASISGSNFSSWYRADEGTLYAEGSVPVGVSSARALASISDGTNNERIIIGHNGTTTTNGLVVDDNVVQVTGFNGGTNTFPPGERRKLALAYKIDDFGFTTVPGTTTAQDSSGTVPTVDRLQIGNAPGRTEPNQPIQRLVFWPRRLGNEVLQGITQ